MRVIEYCDLDIIRPDRILLKVYYNRFVGKYIWRDFNDQILKGTTAFDYIMTRTPLMFGFRYRSVVDVEHSPDSSTYEFDVKKIDNTP
jgi:hypothetical protein